MRRYLGIMLVVALLTMAGIWAVRGDNLPFTVAWWTVDNGGGLSADGDYTVIGTIGQFETESRPTDGNYAVSGGFWPAGGAASPEPIAVYLPVVVNPIPPPPQ